MFEQKCIRGTIGDIQVSRINHNLEKGAKHCRAEKRDRLRALFCISNGLEVFDIALSIFESNLLV